MVDQIAPKVVAIGSVDSPGPARVGSPTDLGAFPDARIEVEDMITEGDKVTARVAMSGTHQGEFQGIAPTGIQVQVRAIDIFRIANGKIVEHWGHGDNPADSLSEPKRS